MASRSANEGEIVADRYRIDGWLGQGNMAQVFRATHLGTGRACALKLVHEHLVERPEIRELFVQEARIGGRIGKNPYIVDVFDAGIDPLRGVPFLAMDLLDGVTLDKYIKQRGRLSPDLLRTLWLQLADALEQAHAAGVVHRDLKPQNLFLTQDRRGNHQLRVVDFGIAKLMEEGIQKTATQIGTPAYAAPEQLGNGMRMIAERMGFTVASTVSPATDIWALGVITYELLVGAPPGQLWMGFERAAITDLMVCVATGPTPQASVCAGPRATLLPHGFDAWLERCLRKNAVERWPSFEVAVQNLLSLFESGHKKLQTVRLPHAQAPHESPDDAGTRTVLMAPSLSTTNHSAPRSSAEERRSPSITDSNPLPRAPLDSLPASNPPPSNVPRIDATTLGVSETLTPNRAKRVRRMSLVFAGAVMSLAVSSLVVAAFLSEKPNTKPPDALPSAPAAWLDPTVPAPAEAVTPQIAADSPSPSASTPLASATPSDANPKPPNPSAGAATSTAAAFDSVAVLKINSVPPSNVIIDGRPAGITPRSHEIVLPGTHTVMFVHPTKGKRSTTVTVKAGETKAVPMKF